MTEPTKVNLPAWRRGDGKPLEDGGTYLYRDERTERFVEARLTKGMPCYEGRYYCGPLELIFAEPEPEPIQIPGWTATSVYLADQVGQQWLTHSHNGMSGLTMSGSTRAEAVRRFNVAARAIMEAGE